MKLKLVHVIALLTAFVCILMYRGALDSVEYYLQDRAMQHESAIDTRIAIISIDDQSLGELGSWPWSRSIHAELVDTLTKGNPAVIAFDVTFPTRSEDMDADYAFEDAVSRAGNVILPAYGTFAASTKAGDIEALELSEPYLELKEVAGAIAHINTIPDSDRVVRKSLYSFNYDGQSIQSFASAIYQMYIEHSGENVNLKEIPLDDFGRFHISYSNAPREYEAIPYSAVLSGEVPAEYFEDRIVLIGPYAVGFKDDYLTPLSGKGTSYGVEIHANIVQELLENDFKQELDWKWNVAILLVTAGLAYFLFHRLKLLFSILAVATMAVAFIMGGSYIYGKGTIISLGYVIPFLIVSCVVVICFKYVQELLEKRRVTDIFGRYVAPQVVSQILKSGDEGLKLGGSRRELTILFVDIRGFTTLSEMTEPEEIVEILNEYLNLTANCIFEYDGTLDKFIGDATMAIFNAPLLLEDHPMKAVQAAWAMKEGSAAVEEKLIARFGFGVKFGIGIHTGPAVFGNIGSKTRMDYTAIGDTVNTAARLESNAKPGQIIMSEATYEAVKDKVAATSLGEIKVKGKEQGISIFELEGLK